MLNGMERVGGLPRVVGHSISDHVTTGGFNGQRLQPQQWHQGKQLHAGQSQSLHSSDQRSNHSRQKAGKLKPCGLSSAKSTAVTGGTVYVWRLVIGIALALDEKPPEDVLPSTWINCVMNTLQCRSILILQRSLLTPSWSIPRSCLLYP